jgi:hypothetical protein
MCALKIFSKKFTTHFWSKFPPSTMNHCISKKLCLINLQTQRRQFSETKIEDMENFLEILKCYSRKEFYDRGATNYLEFVE